MSQSSTVAYSELTRVLPWSIRARGYPFGTADRASFLVANAASISPEVLSDIAALRDRPPGEPSRRSLEGGVEIEAGGVSWLEVGPALMDYCGARASEDGRVISRVLGATDASLLPAVLLVGADYGLSAVALRIERSALHWTLSGWSGDDPGTPMLVSGEGRPALEARLGGAIDLSDADETPTGTTVVAWREPALLIPYDDAGAVDAKSRIKLAFSQGIPVNPGVLEELYELEKITWAPTSERSRAQAGFQPKPAGHPA